MKPIGPVVGLIRPQERTTEAKNFKKLKFVKTQTIEAIKITSYYLNTMYSSYHFLSY